MGVPVTESSPEPPLSTPTTGFDAVAPPNPAEAVQFRREISAKFAEAIAQAQAVRDKARDWTSTSRADHDRPSPDRALTEEERRMAGDCRRSLSFDFPLVHPEPLRSLLRCCREEMHQILRTKDQSGTCEPAEKGGWKPTFARLDERVVEGLLFLQSQGQAQSKPQRRPPANSAAASATAPAGAQDSRTRVGNSKAESAEQSQGEVEGPWEMGLGQEEGCAPVWETAAAVLQTMLLGVPSACLSLPCAHAAAQTLCAYLPPLPPSGPMSPAPSPPHIDRSSLEREEGESQVAAVGAPRVEIEEVEAAGSESDWEPLEDEAEERREVERETELRQHPDDDAAASGVPLVDRWRHAVPLLRDLLASAGPAAASVRLDSSGASTGGSTDLPPLEAVPALVRIVGNLRRVHRGVEGPVEGGAREQAAGEGDAEAKAHVEAGAAAPGSAAAAVESLSLLCCELLAEALLRNSGEAAGKGPGAGSSSRSSGRSGSSGSAGELPMEGVLRSIMEQGKGAVECRTHPLRLTAESALQGKGEAELRRRLQAQDGWVTLVDVCGSLICRVSSTKRTGGPTGAVGAISGSGTGGGVRKANREAASSASAGGAAVQGSVGDGGGRIGEEDEEEGRQAEAEQERRVQALAEASLLAEQQGRVWRALQALLPQLASFLEDSLAQTRSTGRSSSSSSEEGQRVLRVEFLCGGRLRNMCAILLFFLSHTPNSAPKGVAGEAFLESGMLRGLLGAALVAASLAGGRAASILGAETLKDVHFVLFCYAAAFPKACAFLASSRAFCEAAFGLGQSSSSSAEDSAVESSANAAVGSVDHGAVLRPLGVLWSVLLPAQSGPGKGALQPASAEAFTRQLKLATESFRSSLAGSAEEGGSSSSSSCAETLAVVASSVLSSNSSPALELPVQQLHATLTLLEEAASLALPRTSAPGRAGMQKAQGDTPPLLLEFSRGEVHALAVECQGVCRALSSRTRLAVEEVEGEVGEPGISTGVEGPKKTIALLSRVTAQLKWLCLVSEPVSGSQASGVGQSKAQAARGKAD